MTKKAAARPSGLTLNAAQVKRITQSLNALTGRARLMGAAGTQYGGRRDIYAVAGYPRTLVFDNFWSLYTRGDISGRIVDMQPQTTWRTPPQLVEVGAAAQERTTFVEAFTALAKRLGLWSRFERVDRLAGVGRYAALFIGVRGADDQSLRQEMSKIKGPDDVLYVSVFHEGDATIKEWDTDTSSPRFGLPKIYELNLSSGIPGFQAAKVMVHASRIIHVAEDCLRDDVFGRPKLERLVNRLMDLEKVAASTGEAYWQLGSRVLMAQVAEGAELPAKARADTLEQLEEIVHDLRRVFVGEELDLKWLESTPPNPKGCADLYFTLIAGAAGIPKRILFGSETGERASEQDQLTYLGTINERQERHAEPNIVRAFIDRLLGINGLPAVGSQGYALVWPTLIEASDKDQAETNKSRAEAARALTPLGEDPKELIQIDVKGNIQLMPMVNTPLDLAAERAQDAAEEADDAAETAAAAGDINPDDDPEDVGDVNA